MCGKGWRPIKIKGTQIFGMRCEEAAKRYKRTKAISLYKYIDMAFLEIASKLFVLFPYRLLHIFTLPQPLIAFTSLLQRLKHFSSLIVKPSNYSVFLLIVSHFFSLVQNRGFLLCPKSLSIVSKTPKPFFHMPTYSFLFTYKYLPIPK